MNPRTFQLENGRSLLIRSAEVEDSGALVEFAHAVSAESEFLSFGPGEFELTEYEEEEVLRKIRGTDNSIFLIGTIDGSVVATLSFSAGHRPRTRHSGEFGMGVRKSCWGLGIGSLMLDCLIDWARGSEIVTKFNLRVRTDNLRAIRLYERKGFKREGTIRKDMCIDGRYFDHHWMGLVL
jgi:RimJ/RimL family protein N-acetyltransferase